MEENKKISFEEFEFRMESDQKFYNGTNTKIVSYLIVEHKKIRKQMDLLLKIVKILKKSNKEISDLVLNDITKTLETLSDTVIGMDARVTALEEGSENARIETAAG